MRRAARQDRNHKEISDEFTRLGAFVVDLSGLGDGKPDLFVGIGGVFIPAEVKDGLRPPSKRVLTSDQVDWWMKAGINPRVVTNPLQAQETVKVLQQWHQYIRQGILNAI